MHNHTHNHNPYYITAGASERTSTTWLADWHVSNGEFPRVGLRVRGHNHLGQGGIRVRVTKHGRLVHPPTLTLTLTLTLNSRLAYPGNLVQYAELSSNLGLTRRLRAYG